VATWGLIVFGLNFEAGAELVAVADVAHNSLLSSNTNKEEQGGWVPGEEHWKSLYMYI
jgi:hypothetical protein